MENGIQVQSDKDKNMLSKKSVFLDKKTEKLAAALYLITSFMSEREPLRVRMRQLALRLVNDTSVFRYAEGKDAISSVYKTIEETLSLLDIAHAAGLVSDMNHGILKGEYQGLLSFVQRPEEDIFLSTRMLSREFFRTPADIHNNAERSDVRDHIKDTSQQGFEKDRGDQSKDKRDAQEESIKKEPIRHAISEGGKKTNIEKVRVVNNRNSFEKKNGNRRDAILKLAQKGGEFTIKDVSRTISGCSEKTIQRELLAMVDEGVLRKEGERRWSKYILVS